MINTTIGHPHSEKAQSHLAVASCNSVTVLVYFSSRIPCYKAVCVCVCVAAMKADRKRLKVEKADLASQMQQLYTTLESREEQLREFIRNYDQHRKVTSAWAREHTCADCSAERVV